MSGGRTHESTWCAIEAMSQKRLSLRLQQEGRPEKSFKTVAQMVEDYQANLGPQGDWSGDTLRNRTSDFKQLIEIGKSVPCDTLTNHHLRRDIDTAPTAARAKHTEDPSWLGLCNRLPHRPTSHQRRQRDVEETYELHSHSNSTRSGKDPRSAAVRCP